MTNHTLQKQMFQTGAVLAGLSVAIGAFGAHQLKDSISDASLDTFQTAVRYQFYHGLAILTLGGMLRRLNEKTAKLTFNFFLFGVIIFCGSLYILSTRELTLGDSLKWLGGLAPLGGLLFISGWAMIAYNGYKFTMDGEGESNRHKGSKRHHSSHKSKTEEEEK